MEGWRRKSPVRPGGLGGRGAIVAEHEHEGTGEVVGQGAAAIFFPHGEQEEQQQKEQQQQLQGERRAAHLLEKGARPSPPLSLLESIRLPWRILCQQLAGVLEFGLV